MTPGYSNTSKATWTEIVGRLKETFEKWGVGPEDYHIDHDPDVARANLSRDNWGFVAWARVRYRAPGTNSMVEMRLQSQSSPAKNLGSIAITLESIRMQDRRGLSGLVAAHHLALNAPVTARDPYEVLSVRPDAPLSVVEASYKALAKGAHPDAGGSEEKMTELNEALEEVKRRAS